MEPQQARLTFFVFLSFTVAIVFNALYFQKDAGFAVRGSYSGTVSMRAGEEMQMGNAIGKTVKGNDLLRAIRRELANHNYFPGNSSSRLDGRVDAMTMGAIMAYQYDSGLAVTGLVSDGLLKSFLFGVDKRASRRARRPVFSRDTRQLVAEIQGILSAKGHYTGKIDGLFASKTMGAVKRFESNRGLPVTGRISGLLVQELSRATGVAFSASQK